jgi:hypothetical protein
MEGSLSELAKPEPLMWILAPSIFVYVFFRPLMAFVKDVD